MFTTWCGVKVNILWVVEEKDGGKWQIVEGCDVCFSKREAQKRKKELVGIYTSPKNLRIVKYYSGKSDY